MKVKAKCPIENGLLFRCCENEEFIVQQASVEYVFLSKNEFAINMGGHVTLQQFELFFEEIE